MTWSFPGCRLTYTDALLISRRVSQGVPLCTPRSAADTDAARAYLGISKDALDQVRRLCLDLVRKSGNSNEMVAFQRQRRRLSSSSSSSSSSTSSLSSSSSSSSSRRKPLLSRRHGDYPSFPFRPGTALAVVRCLPRVNALRFAAAQMILNTRLSKNAAMGSGAQPLTMAVTIRELARWRRKVRFV